MHMHSKFQKFAALCLAVALFVSCTVFSPSTAKASTLTWTGGFQDDVMVSGTTTINVSGDNQVPNITFTTNSTLTIKGNGTLYIGNITSNSGTPGTNYTGSGNTGSSSYGSNGINVAVIIDGPTTTINKFASGAGGNGGTADRGTNDYPDGSGGHSVGGNGGDITLTVNSGQTTLKAITAGSGGAASTAGNGGTDVRASDSLMTGSDGGNSLGGKGGSITITAAGQLTLPSTITGGTGGAAGQGGYYTEYSKQKGAPGRSVGGAGGNVVLDLADGTQLSTITVNGGTGGAKGNPGYTGYAADGSTGTVSIMDNYPPKLNVTRSPNIDVDSWTNQPVTLTVTATDKGAAGLAAAPYSYDDGNTWTTITTKTFDSNQTITIKAKDANGNIATKTIALQIDKDAPTAPAITAPSGIANWTNQTVTCTLTDGTDPVGGSGVAYTEYQLNDSDWAQYTSAIEITTATTITARTVDAAGNISSTSTMTIQVDQIAPAPPDYQFIN